MTVRAVELTELVNRGQGIEQPGPIHDWWVLAKPATLSVPAGPLVIRALAGLETELAQQRIDLTGQSRASLRVPLTRFFRARAAGQLAGNTHLHLMKLSKAQADRYLRDVPTVDDLDIVFLSYLERANATPEYTSNNYSRHDLEKLSHGHVHFGNGQEHRHNFGKYGEGYGHILLLDIPYIIHPVSIGPGITATGVDAPPLQAGIDTARSVGGKVIWAHNLYGFEDIPNWITGRVHANNIFDGSAKGSYKDTYYRYLNVGLARAVFHRNRLVHLRFLAGLREQRPHDHADRVARPAGGGKVLDHQWSAAGAHRRWPERRQRARDRQTKVGDGPRPMPVAARFQADRAGAKRPSD